MKYFISRPEQFHKASLTVEDKYIDLYRSIMKKDYWMEVSFWRYIWFRLFEIKV